MAEEELEMGFPCLRGVWSNIVAPSSQPGVTSSAQCSTGGLGCVIICMENYNSYGFSEGWANDGLIMG